MSKKNRKSATGIKVISALRFDMLSKHKKISLYLALVLLGLGIISNFFLTQQNQVTINHLETNLVEGVATLNGYLKYDANLSDTQNGNYYLLLPDDRLILLVDSDDILGKLKLNEPYQVSGILTVLEGLSPAGILTLSNIIRLEP